MVWFQNLKEMKRKIKITSLTIGILVVLKFWVGIYEDGEWDDKYLFIKHRPIWKTYFYSPRGMSDLRLSEMNGDKQKEQLLYDEFILNIKPEENNY